jgi:hypothetical protein
MKQPSIQAQQKSTLLANSLNSSSVLEHNDNDSDMETWLQPCCTTL